jgi:hypothetical protein
MRPVCLMCGAPVCRTPVCCSTFATFSAFSARSIIDCEAMIAPNICKQLQQQQHEGQLGWASTPQRDGPFTVSSGRRHGAAAALGPDLCATARR